MRLIYLKRNTPNLILDKDSLAARDLFLEGKHREGIDALSQAIHHADGGTSHQYWLKGQMYAAEGHSSLSHSDRAMSYRLANLMFGEAVLRDARILESFGSFNLPETSWAIPGYPSLVASCLHQPGFIHLCAISALCRCTFAPEAALQALEDERVQQFVNYGLVTQESRKRFERALSRIRHLADIGCPEDGNEVGPGELETDEAELMSRYAQPLGVGSDTCAYDDWQDELTLHSAALIGRLASQCSCERARAACLLGVRRHRTVEAVQALRTISIDKNLKVRTQALVARARIAHDDVVLREADPTLGQNLVETLQSDKSYRVKAAAADALAIFVPGVQGPSAVELLGALKAVSVDSHAWVQVRALAARARIATDAPALRNSDPTLEEHLTQALKSNNYEMVRVGADGLAKLGSRPNEMIPTLVKLLASPEAEHKYSRLTFLEALTNYCHSNEATLNEAALGAIQNYEPDDSAESEFILKGRTLLRFSSDSVVVEECRQYLVRCQRYAEHSTTRRAAIDALIEAHRAPDLAVAILVERMYLDHSVAIREYARHRLIHFDHELSVKLDASYEKI